MTNYDTPTDMTYRDYMEHVETAAKSVIINTEDYPEDFDDIHDAVWQTVDGARLVNNYGYMMMTVLLSDQNPDRPDYCEPWTVYVDLSNDPTWSDAVSAMAYVCYYSDVMDKVKRLQEDDE